MNDFKLFAVFICVAILSLDVLSAPAANSDNKTNNNTSDVTPVNKDPKSNISKTDTSKTAATKSVTLKTTNKNSIPKGSNSKEATPDSKSTPKTESKGNDASSKTTTKANVTESSKVRTNKGTEPVKTDTKKLPETNINVKAKSSVQSKTAVKTQTSDIKPKTDTVVGKPDVQSNSKANQKTDSLKSTKPNTASTRKEDSSTKSANKKVRSSTDRNKPTTGKDTKIAKPAAKQTRSITEKTVVKQTKPKAEKTVVKQSKPATSAVKQTQPEIEKKVAKQIKPTTSPEKQTKVDDNVITTSTTTEATVTDTIETATTWDGLPCSTRFRAHPVDKSKFETAFAENVFEKIYHSCPTPLVWRQDQCRCGWAEPEQVESCNCCGQGLKSHETDTSMYLRLVNGVWLEETCNTFDSNQIWDDEKCNCIWDPNKPQTHKAPVFRAAVLPKVLTKCMNLVNMTLDEGLKDSGGRDLTPLFGRQRIRVVDEKGDTGKSVEIRRAPFKIGIFNGNDLQSTVYFKFNFKVHQDQVRRRRKMVIMSNGCKRRWQRKTLQPSLEVAFFPFNETFEVQFSTTGKTIVEYIKGTKDSNGWYQCVLYLQDRKLNLEVNGQKVYSTNGMSGRVKTTDCPLTVAGSPVNAKHHFDGYIDELNVVKQCKYESDAAS